MKSHRKYLFATLLLFGSAFAAEPPQTDAAQLHARIQAEQGKRQALADALWRYLKSEPARKRQLDEAADRVYGLALRDGDSSDLPPATVSAALVQWQEALHPLRALELNPASATGLKTLDDALKAAVQLLSAVPAVTADTPPMRRVERQQALLAAASALLDLRQKAVLFDAQLDEAARRSAAGARLLADQVLMLPAPPKGEKP